MKEKNKIELTKIATILLQLTSDTNYNGKQDLTLVNVKAINDIGKEIEKIVESELDNK